MEYVVDLESYSLIFRPCPQFTEVIQYTRYEYNPDNVALVSSLIKDNLVTESSLNFSLEASSVFVCLLNSSELELRRSSGDVKGGHWYVVDSRDEEVFDLAQDRFGSSELLENDAVGNQEGRPGCELAPTSELFDSLMVMQPQAKRYEVDELITTENKGSSEFLAYKSHMDYLFNLGVFGFNQKAK
jgi:hypothetical protein